MVIDQEYIKQLRTRAQKAAKAFAENEQTRTLRSSDEKNEHGNNGATYLFIRAFDGDNGDRPLPAGTVCWLSPDIQVFDAAGNNITATEIAVGKNYTVKVVVYNSGDQDCNSCTVDLFIVGQTVGLNGSHIQPVGIKTASVRAHSSEIVEFPFVATQDGHNCLFARVYNLVMNDYPTDMINFNTFFDRHIGQHNLNMVKQGTIMKFNVSLAPMPLDTETIIRVTTATTAIKKTKLPVIKKYATVKRTIVQGAFKLHKVIVKEPAIAINPGRIPEMPFGREVPAPLVVKPSTPVELLPVKQLAKDKWAPARDRGTCTYQIEIPMLDLKPNEMVPLNIQVTDTKTGSIIGGISFLVVG